MRTFNFCLLACVLLFATVSCKKSLEEGNICDGLLQNGTADSASFLKPGTDWQFKNFSYTPNGKDIIYRDTVLPGILRTNGTDTMQFLCYNEGRYVPTFFAGSNQLKMKGGTSTMVYVPKELPIYLAFENAICYAIQGDMLYIHFKESEGKNLFILQRK